MKKKKTDEAKINETPVEYSKPRLDPDKYWEWRTTICEMQLSEQALKIGQIQHEVFMKDQEILKLKSAIFKQSLQSAEEKKSLAKSEYERFKKNLEDQLGISLSGCTINDVTFEITKLEE